MLNSTETLQREFPSSPSLILSVVEYVDRAGAMETEAGNSAVFLWRQCCEPGTKTKIHGHGALKRQEHEILKTLGLSPLETLEMGTQETQKRSSLECLGPVLELLLLAT